jgi:hypothetical protein
VTTFLVSLNLSKTMWLLPLSKSHYQTNMKVCYAILTFLGKEKRESMVDLLSWQFDCEGEILSS